MTAPNAADLADADAAAELHHRGLSNADIADQLGLSVGAIPAYISAGRQHQHDLAHQRQLPLFS